MKKARRKKESGQTLVEYLLVLFVLVSGYLFLFSQLKKSQFFFKNFSEPLLKYVTYNYKYADPSAQGWDEGNPVKHIQISQPNYGSTFKIFQPNDNPNQ